jgi:hypothetical protein
MKKVDLLKTELDGSQTVITTFGFDGERVILVKGDSQSVRDILEHGITGRMDKIFTVEDGLDFLKEMKYTFTGSYIRASEVYED